MHFEPHFLKRAFFVPAISQKSSKTRAPTKTAPAPPPSPPFPPSLRWRPATPPPTPLVPPQRRATSWTPSPLPVSPTHRSIPLLSCSTPTTTRRMVEFLRSPPAPRCVPRRLLAPPVGRRGRNLRSRRSPCPRGGSSAMAWPRPLLPLGGGCVEPRGYSSMRLPLYPAPPPMRSLLLPLFVVRRARRRCLPCSNRRPLRPINRDQRKRGTRERP